MKRPQEHRVKTQPIHAAIPNDAEMALRGWKARSETLRERTDRPEKTKRKAFIAAPLIGTLIFLTAILFIFNLNRLEVTDTSRIVNDAYHNRIVSTIEIYRSDLNSVFRETLARNIQENILAPGWLTLGISNHDSSSGDEITYAKMRENRCQQIRTTSVDMVCSVGRQASNKDQNSYGYGIPAWIAVASE
ncbi:MAG TPA: hypothetical protein VI874_01000, partial [Candidatus Norongarragalinales archaeon]|nr:hypothetical protein [Candidatus Norongarragalinales archaeon]